GEAPAERTADPVASAGDDDDRVGEAHSKMTSSPVSAAATPALGASLTAEHTEIAEISYDFSLRSLRSRRFRRRRTRAPIYRVGTVSVSRIHACSFATSRFTVRDAANSTTARITASTGTMYIAVCSPAARNGSSARTSNPFDSPTRLRSSAEISAVKPSGSTAPAALAFWNVK